MRLHHYAQCPTAWTIRAIDSTAGWTVPVHYFPDGSTSGSYRAGDLCLLFSLNEKPQWIGVLAFDPVFSSTYSIVQLTEDEVILVCGAEVLSVPLFSPDSPQSVFSQGSRSPQIEVRDEAIFVISHWGLYELKNGQVDEVCAGSDYRMLEDQLGFDTAIIRNPYCYDEGLYRFDLVLTEPSPCVIIVRYSSFERRMLNWEYLVNPRQSTPQTKATRS